MLSKVSTKNGYVGVFVLPLPSSFLLLLFSVSPKRLARKGVLGLVGPFELVFVDEERSWLMIELSGRARPRTPEKESPLLSIQSRSPRTPKNKNGSSPKRRRTSGGGGSLDKREQTSPSF